MIQLINVVFILYRRGTVQQLLSTKDADEADSVSHHKMCRYLLSLIPICPIMVVTFYKFVYTNFLQKPLILDAFFKN